MKRRLPKPRVVLPPPCMDCLPYEGRWRKDPLSGGMERCTCARGEKLLAGLGRKRKPKPGPRARFSGRPDVDGRQAAAGDDE